jgi:hypothetical protein
MEPEGSLHLSKEPTTSSHLEPDESRPKCPNHGYDMEYVIFTAPDKIHFYRKF